MKTSKEHVTWLPVGESPLDTSSAEDSNGSVQQGLGGSRGSI